MIFTSSYLVVHVNKEKALSSCTEERIKKNAQIVKQLIAVVVLFILSYLPVFGTYVLLMFMLYYLSTDLVYSEKGPWMLAQLHTHKLTFDPSSPNSLRRRQKFVQARSGITRASAPRLLLGTAVIAQPSHF